MRSDQALRYLLLKHLWKLRSLTEPDLHAEIARSLTVEQVGGHYVVSWTRRDGPNRLECPADRFLFYKRADVPGKKEGSQATASAHDNEEAARQMAAGILAVPLPRSEKRAPVDLYGDVWRWPLLCAVAAAACFVTSRSLLPVVLAVIAVLESRARTYRLYFPLVVAMVLGRYRMSAVLIGIALAGMTCLASTTGRGRLDALGYLMLAYSGWRVGSDSHAAPPDLSYILPFVLISGCAWTILWLSFEGPRLSILIAPIAAVSLLFDRHLDLALAYLSVCVIYSAWLIVPVGLREKPESSVIRPVTDARTAGRD